jgi:hypothetical protein
MTQPGRNNQKKSGLKRNFRRASQNKPKATET